MDNPFKSPAVISFCPGLLGLERGIERAFQTKLRVVAYSEIEAFIIKNLTAGMEQGLLAPAPIWSDLKTFPSKDFYKKVHGVLGGYPCTPFSNAGQRKGKEDPRHLWPYIRTHIRAAKPLWCGFENVGAHLKFGFDEVLKDLRELGYLVEAGLYSAEEAGAPHRRERLFILAILADTVSMGKAGKFGPLLRASENDEGKTQRQDGEWMRTGLIDSSENVGDTHGTRHQRIDIKESGGKSGTSKHGEMANADIRRTCWWDNERMEWIREPFAWPAGPGQPQHEWEPSRISDGKAEPPLGCTINGYNFREDFLRALGNSVVEQTAEIAFNDLLHKHFA